MRRFTAVRTLTFALAAFLGLNTPLAGQAREMNMQNCVESNPDLRIGGCTALIQSGLETNEHLAIAFNNRGGAYLLKKEYARAIQDYEDAIRLNPSYVDAYYSRAIAYTDMGDYDRAIQDYDAAIRLNPSHANALGNRGFTRFYLGRFADAQADFARALQINPGSTDVAIWLYVAQSRAGQEQEARSELEKNAAQLKLTAWPGPVINLYLGKATPEEVLYAAADSNTRRDQAQHCKAYFYLGENALIAGRRAEAKRQFQLAIDTGVTTLMEYAAAEAELDRVPAAPAAPAKPRHP